MQRLIKDRPERISGHFPPWAEERRVVDHLLVSRAALFGADLDAVHVLGSAHAAIELKHARLLINDRIIPTKVERAKKNQLAD